MESERVRLGKIFPEVMIESDSSNPLAHLAIFFKFVVPTRVVEYILYFIETRVYPACRSEVKKKITSLKVMVFVFVKDWVAVVEVTEGVEIFGQAFDEFRPGVFILVNLKNFSI